MILELDKHVPQLGEDASFTLPIEMVFPEVVDRGACVEETQKLFRREDLVGGQFPTNVFSLGIVKALFGKECEEIGWNCCHIGRLEEKCFAPGQKEVRRAVLLELSWDLHVRSMR